MEVVDIHGEVYGVIFEKDTSFFVGKDNFTADAYIKFANDSMYWYLPINFTKSRRTVQAAQIVSDTIYTYSSYVNKYVRTSFTVTDTATHKEPNDILVNDTTEYTGYLYFKQ
jgi:hypothetical protein